jgi:hypothetical protein
VQVSFYDEDPPEHEYPVSTVHVDEHLKNFSSLILSLPITSLIIAIIT